MALECDILLMDWPRVSLRRKPRVNKSFVKAQNGRCAQRNERLSLFVIVFPPPQEVRLTVRKGRRDLLIVFPPPQDNMFSPLCLSFRQHSAIMRSNTNNPLAWVRNPESSRHHSRPSPRFHWQFLSMPEVASSIKTY